MNLAYSKESISGCSVIIASMNRTERLLECLDKLIKHRQVTEIIIVDWNSSRPLVQDLENYPDQRLVIVSVSGVSSWNLSRANNLGAKFCRCKYLCKMDVDYVLRDGFFDKHPTDSSALYTADYKLARDENERSLSGFFLIPRTDFQKVNGFNERIEGWGYDELDLYQRLILQGLNLVPVNFDYVWHEPHSDNLRSANTPGVNRYLNELYNRAISEACPWLPDEPNSNFEVRKISDRKYNCHFLSGPRPVPVEIVEAKIAEVTSFLTRYQLQKHAIEAGGHLWNKSPEQLEQIISRHAPSGLKYFPWIFRRELKEYYHFLNRSLSLSRHSELKHRSRSLKS